MVVMIGWFCKDSDFGGIVGFYPDESSFNGIVSPMSFPSPAGCLICPRNPRKARGRWQSRWSPRVWRNLLTRDPEMGRTQPWPGELQSKVWDEWASRNLAMNFAGMWEMVSLGLDVFLLLPTFPYLPADGQTHNTQELCFPIDVEACYRYGSHRITSTLMGTYFQRF